MKPGWYSNTCIRRLVKTGYLKRFSYSIRGLEYDGIGRLVDDGVIVCASINWVNVPTILMRHSTRNGDIYKTVRPLL